MLAFSGVLVLTTLVTAAGVILRARSVELRLQVHPYRASHLYPLAPSTLLRVTCVARCFTSRVSTHHHTPQRVHVAPNIAQATISPPLSPAPRTPARCSPSIPHPAPPRSPSEGALRSVPSSYASDRGWVGGEGNGSGTAPSIVVAAPSPRPLQHPLPCTSHRRVLARARRRVPSHSNTRPRPGARRAAQRST